MRKKHMIQKGRKHEFPNAVMMKKSSIVFAIIAGVEFLLFTVSMVIQDILLLIDGNEDFLWFNEIMMIVINAAFAALLFLRKKNILFVIVASVNLALNIFFLIRYFSLVMCFPVLAALSLLFVIVINCVSPLRNLSEITKFIWFLPFVFILIYHFYP